jgi:hypothetical protein
MRIEKKSGDSNNRGRGETSESNPECVVGRVRGAANPPVTFEREAHSELVSDGHSVHNGVHIEGQCIGRT